MADTNIRVTVVGSAFTYTNDVTGASATSLVITPKSKLRWICAQGAIAVFFKDGRTAMANGAQVLSADKNELTKKLQVKDIDNGNPPFRYGVAVLDAANVIQTNDPDIVIDDGLGGAPARARRIAAARSTASAKPAKTKAKPAKKKARKGK